MTVGRPLQRLEIEVVGVSADYKVRFPTEAPAPYLHLAASQRPQWSGAVLARTRGDAAALAADIRRELRRTEPDLFFLRTETLRETADVTVLPFRLAATVAGASGIVAALLGVVGLYGVIAYLVVRRTGEIAIRSALGARTGALLRHVLATGGWVVAVGLGSGAVLALVVHGVAARVAAGVLAADAVVWTGVRSSIAPLVTLSTNEARSDFCSTVTAARRYSSTGCGQ